MSEPGSQGAAGGPRPRVVVVMGVSGSGKSTVGACLAERLGWRFADGDAFHSAGDVARMRTGHPLTDADRAPWLAAVAAWIGRRVAEGEGGVVACSALRRAYRDGLRAGRPEVRIVYLKGSRPLVAARIAARKGHFMPASLLDSQFSTLEEPAAEEGVLSVGIEAPPATIVDTIMAGLGLERERAR